MSDFVYVPSVLKTVPLGWKCPECETVYAPWVQKCECRKQKPVTTSANTGLWRFTSGRGNDFEAASAYDYVQFEESLDENKPAA